MTSEKPETNREKPKTTASTKSEKPLVFLPETENQMLIEGKPGNRSRHQNRKTAVFCCENRKTDLKNGQNRKTENPKVPLLLQYSLENVYCNNGCNIAKLRMTIEGHQRTLKSRLWGSWLYICGLPVEQASQDIAGHSGDRRGTGNDSASCHHIHFFDTRWVNGFTFTLNSMQNELFLSITL